MLVRPAVFSVLLALSITQGAVVRLEIEPVAPAEKDANLPATYEMLRGKVYGELDPADRRNAMIQDLELAPRNKHGRVDYVSTFTLYRPVSKAKSSGVLLYEVVNRGGSLSPRDYATGDVFLQSGWQGDISFGGPAINGSHGETVQVPIAHNPDGSPATGPVLARFANVRSRTNTLPVRAASGYASSGVPPIPVSTDTRQSTLTTHSYEDTRGVVARPASA